MPGILAVSTFVLLIAMVVWRVGVLKRHGIAAMQFGHRDRSDFLIPPFVLFYLYLVSAAAFGLPSPANEVFFHAAALEWAGVALCLAGGVLFLGSLLSLGRSFRVGIDDQHPGSLVTSGVFAFSRNPIYLAFAIVLLGQFLVFSHWIMLLYTLAAAGLFHRQVLREEQFLRKHYG